VVDLSFDLYPFGEFQILALLTSLYVSRFRLEDHGGEGNGDQTFMAASGYRPVAIAG
jgi:hypothetical protein